MHILSLVNNPCDVSNLEGDKWLKNKYKKFEYLNYGKTILNLCLK